MFSCDVCQKNFSQKGNLKTHIRIHTGEKPFKCDICEKSFSQGGGLTAHMRFHTGEKPYSCDTCENAFRTIGELSRHKRIHTGENPYSCDTCFVDCGEADVKLEIKEEETLDEDPLSINMEAENVEETIKQETEEEGQDQDFFSCEQNLGEDRSRVGGSDLTTMIGPGRGMASFSMDGQPMYNNRKTQSSSDRTLINAFRTISNMADRIHLTKTIQDRANNLFKMVHDGKNLKGRTNDAIVATCLYIACRQEGVPRTFNEIVAVSTDSKKEIGRCFKLILKAHDTSVELITTGDFMSRFCCTLNLPRDVQKAATHIAKKAVDLDIVPSRSPISVAAAAMYMASQASDDKRKQRDIGEIVGVLDVTIRQSYKLMLPSAKDLFPADFKFTSPIENLPHN